MRYLPSCLAACAAALMFCAPVAQAVTCDIVLDRNGAVVYQDTVPPVDLSERGAAAREKMRQRGDLLMIIDTDQCPRLVLSGPSGAASVDEIVAGMRPYIAVSGGMGVTARPSAGASEPPGAPTSTSTPTY